MLLHGQRLKEATTLFHFQEGVPAVKDKKRESDKLESGQLVAQSRVMIGIT